MLENKRNMLLETFTTPFLVTRIDIKNTHGKWNGSKQLFTLKLHEDTEVTLLPLHQMKAMWEPDITLANK